MAASTAKVFTCSICNDNLGESPFSTHCGHLFHRNCISQWLLGEGSKTCPNCRNHVEDVNLIRLFPTEDDDKYHVKTKEEMEKIRKHLSIIGTSNINFQYKVSSLSSRLTDAEENLNKSLIALTDINTVFENHHSNCVNNNNSSINKDSFDYQLNQEKSKRILLQKECYEYHSIAAAELKELKDEINKLKSEKDYLKKKCRNLKLPSTSSKIVTRNTSALPRQIQSPIQPSSDGFLSNCHFWIVDELRKVSGATNHLHFNEDRVIEHGGTVAYHYTNMVTHVIGISQKNFDVIRGLKQRKKCATDYWLSDVIGQRKLIKPWLPHHFPIPYSEDNLPYEKKQIAIINFDKNEYHKIKAMAEILGATVINKVSRSTDIVISLKLKGEMIKKALALKIPVVNAQWISDILLDEKIGLQDFKHRKYLPFDSGNLYSVNYNILSHITEAWEKRLKIPRLKHPTNKVVNKSTLANNKRKTCVIQDYSASGVNNKNANHTITSAATTSNGTEPRIKLFKSSIRQ